MCGRDADVTDTWPIEKTKSQKALLRESICFQNESFYPHFDKRIHQTTSSTVSAISNEFVLHTLCNAEYRGSFIPQASCCLSEVFEKRKFPFITRQTVVGVLYQTAL